MLRGLVDFRPAPHGSVPIEEVEETKYPFSMFTAILKGEELGI
jgi:hypothetical protein